MNKKIFKNIIGLTLIEILIGIVITTIMMAAMYTSYNVVNQSYSKVVEKAKISKSSRDLVSMLMRDIRMSGFKYYAGHQQIKDFAEATDAFCSPPAILPKLSNLYYETGFDEPEHSHNPIVIRKNTLGKEAVTSEPSVTCCDQIQIVYDDFNQNDYFQPFKRYRITYYAEPNNEGSFAVYKRIESYIKRNGDDCSFSIQPESDDEGNTIPLTVADLRGTWEDQPRTVPTPDPKQPRIKVCAVCTPGVMIRDHVEDMEFIPYDQNGRIIQEDGKFPAPDQGISTDLRARLLDIRGVDIKLIFRSKEHFFKKAQARTVVGLSDRNLSTTDRYLRDSVIVSVYTRNIGGAF